VLKPENEGTSKKSKSNSKKKQIDDITETKTKEQVAHRGAVLTLQFIAQKFGIQLFESLPNLWAITGQVISQFNLLSVESSAETTIQNEQTVINGLHIITTIASSIDSNLHSVLEQLFDSIVSQVPFSNERTIPYIALAIATLCTVITSRAMKIIIEKLFPMLADPKNYNARRGSVSVIYKIITTLDLDILPYIVFFVVPLLKRMSDQDQVTRELAANCFGVIIKILPLERSAKSVVGFEESREKERKFIEQLLDNSKVEPFELPIKINAELRQYQKDGISWMAFLNKYNLHGILCDDMGLGKTLQTICIVASDIEIRKRLYEQTKAAEYIHLPSLVVCPPTLVGHWNHEIEKFCPQLSVIQYSGSIQQRKLLRERFSSSDVTVMSYDVLRNDIDKIMQVQSCWNYCILDEGHIIKNKATQITKAVKMINANHRLILSGTPIQNNVLELWSLFDFLMPGFLGTEKEFNNRYGKPILASKDAKANSKEQAEGTLAMEALHRQVLPFLLRRVKEDVLQDLPEKIIQDYYCELSSLQAQLYESFYKSQVHEEIAETLEHIEQEGIQSIENAANKQHVFQALQYLRKLCNHPCLVLNPEHPQYHKITAELEQQGKSIQDISLSPKMLALKQLLLDCGIGLNATSNEQIDFVSQHRVLIFCQLKSVLDIIEHELFRNHMPFVSYMRLDGSVEQSKRFAIVHKFNSDPSIDVLLLTTHVGGLGLNLTGADTVIFVEHDWNPSADLQAMDRAHRIGQKKVVNVYRIITKDTLEERIMGLQRFKLNISKAVINTENSSTRTMNTDQLVNLFQLSDKTPSSSSINAIDVTDEQIEKQYEEFDLSSFLQKLK
jgi:TATA-binding protein-associated factor